MFSVTYIAGETVIMQGTVGSHCPLDSVEIQVELKCLFIPEKRLTMSSFSLR